VAHTVLGESQMTERTMMCIERLGNGADSL